MLKALLIINVDDIVGFQLNKCPVVTSFFHFNNCFFHFNVVGMKKMGNEQHQKLPEAVVVYKISVFFFNFF
jgi:hypothetical protein